MKHEDDSARSAPRGFGGRELHRWLIAAALVGAVMLTVTSVLKLAADDFGPWRALKRGDARIGRVVEAVPVLDLERWPALSRWSWHDSASHGVIGTYAADAAFLVLLVVASLVFRRRVRRWLDPAAAWMRGRDHRRARLTVTVAVAIVVLTYLTKSFLGFWFPGIGGWTYDGWRSAIRAELPLLEPGREAADLAAHPWLERAVLPEVGPLLERTGFLSGPAVFVHGRTGEPRPVNLELTGLVFPQNVFGHPERGAGDEALFLRLLRHGLDQRHAGRRFLLPRGLAYPPHSVYVAMPEGPLPSGDELVRVSFWTLTLRIEPDAPARIVRAVREHVIDVP